MVLSGNSSYGDCDLPPALLRGSLEQLGTYLTPTPRRARRRAAAAAELGAELQPLAWDGRAFRGVSWVD